MKSKSSHRSHFGWRVMFATLSLVALALCTMPLFKGRAAAPGAGTITATSTTPVSWTGNAIGGTNPNGEGGCTEGVNCDTFTLTVAGTQADWTDKRIKVTYTWSVAGNDYDMFIHKGSNAGEEADHSTGGAPSTSEVAYINPEEDGTGVFTVHAVYFTVTPVADQYRAVAAVVSGAPAPPPPAPADNGPKIGYQNYEAPGVLTEVSTSSQGPAAHTVEYLGHDAGEPSIGNNWRTGITNYQSDLQTLFIRFNDNCPLSGETATWVNRPAPTSQLVDSDPIGFTDRQTGRVFAGQLTLLSPTCKTSYSDDDGLTWVPTEGSGIPSSVDHQTIGGGPFHQPLTRPKDIPGLYPNAVYYCSQLPDAACSRSDDGGLTFGPTVPVDMGFECGGLHGHLKVGPDGTAYLPNNSCGGTGATIVSEDNGITWTIRKVRSASQDTYASSALQDPAVGIDNNNRVYFVMASASSAAAVAVSDDHGNSWRNIYDVGAAYGLKNIAYPAAVAADAGRAAVAFYGTTTPGNAQGPSFNGVWHLYIAHTFDGGNTWTTSDATPNAPMQRGCIWMGGGASICRNLLDFFDMTVDKQGRVQVGYVNGCSGGNCAQAVATATGNAYTATAVIARQSSGRRLVAAYDPPSPLTATSVPGIPSVSTRRDGPVVHLSWSEADTGNSTILQYRILRGTTSGGSGALLATVPGTQSTYDDLTATDTGKTYYYRVQAVNARGTGCANTEVAAPYVGDSCTGMILQRTPPGHPESAFVSGNPTVAFNPSLAIDYIAAGEPVGTSNLMLRMKVTSLSGLPANSRWRIVWNSFSSPGQQWYVGMTTDASGIARFEYGTIATGVVGLVIGVPTETEIGSALPESNYNPDGTITIYVPKSAVGNPQPGDLLGAVNGRTFTGDNAQTQDLERSTLLIDHTFVKAQRDNGSPAATYMIKGSACQ
jgi:fibronectin type III domain protein